MSKPYYPKGTRLVPLTGEEFKLVLSKMEEGVESQLDWEISMYIQEIMPLEYVTISRGLMIEGMRHYEIKEEDELYWDENWFKPLCLDPCSVEIE